MSESPARDDTNAVVTPVERPFETPSMAWMHEEDIDDTLEHVVCTVLGFPSDGMVFRALTENGIETVEDILMLDTTALSTLKYRLDTTPLTSPPDGLLSALDHAKLRHLGTFHATMCALVNEEFMLGDVAWSRITARDFKKFVFQQNRAKPPLQGAQTPSQAWPTTPQASTPSSVVSAPIARTPKENFASGIKKDPEQYPAFKESRFWDSWNRELHAKAALHDVLDVLDGTYVPTTPDAIELFEFKKRFMHSVFLSKVTVADAVNIVKTTKDAQKCYQLLVTRYEHSPEASMDAQLVREKIVALKLDKSWRGGAVKFITHFQSQMILLESLTTDPTLLWHPNAKLAQLTSAVSSHAELHSIWAAERLDAVKSNRNITYEQYLSLAKSKAHEIDSREGTTNPRHNRNINAHERGGRNPGGGRGGKGRGNEKWRTKNAGGGKALSQVDNDLYNKLPDDIKAVIRNARKTAKGNTPADASATPAATRTFTRTANAATTTPGDVTNTTTQSASAGIIQTITGSNASADIRNVLAASRGPSPNSTGEYYTDNEGKVFISLNVLRSYRVNGHEHATPIGALIDGGANGGMTGTDVLVVATHDHDCATVTGIAGNKLQNLPIVTAAGYIESTDGPVIGIFHQYAYHQTGRTIHSVPQVEHFDISVDCKSRLKSGMQRIVTLDGWVIPLHIRNGLAHMDMRPPTEKEMAKYPHVIFTSDDTWDPRVLDDETDLNVLNDNLVLIHESSDTDIAHEEYNMSRSSGNGEMAQRVIANMLFARITSDSDVALDHEDCIDYLASERRIPFNKNGIFRHYPELDR